MLLLKHSYSEGTVQLSKGIELFPTHLWIPYTFHEIFGLGLQGGQKTKCRKKYFSFHSSMVYSAGFQLLAFR